MVDLELPVGASAEHSHLVFAKKASKSGLPLRVGLGLRRWFSFRIDWLVQRAIRRLGREHPVFQAAIDCIFVGCGLPSPRFHQVMPAIDEAYLDLSAVVQAEDADATLRQSLPVARQLKQQIVWQRQNLHRLSFGPASIAEGSFEA